MNSLRPLDPPGNATMNDLMEEIAKGNGRAVPRDPRHPPYDVCWNCHEGRHAECSAPGPLGCQCPCHGESR